MQQAPAILSHRSSGSAQSQATSSATATSRASLRIEPASKTHASVVDLMMQVGSDFLNLGEGQVIGTLFRQTVLSPDVREYMGYCRDNLASDDPAHLTAVKVLRWAEPFLKLIGGRPLDPFFALQVLAAADKTVEGFLKMELKKPHDTVQREMIEKALDQINVLRPDWKPLGPYLARELFAKSLAEAGPHQVRQMLLRALRNTSNDKVEVLLCFLLSETAKVDSDVAKAVDEAAPPLQVGNQSIPFTFSALRQAMFTDALFRTMTLKLFSKADSKYVEAYRSKVVADLAAADPEVAQLAMGITHSQKTTSIRDFALRALGTAFRKEIETRKKCQKDSATLLAFTKQQRNGKSVQSLLDGAHHGPPRVDHGTDFDGHRAYQPGDPVRAIDWHATARVGSPVVKIDRPPTSSRVTIVIDPMVLSHSGFDRHKQVAVVSGMIAAAAINGKEEVALIIGDNYYIAPSTDRGQLEAFLFAIYNAVPAGENQATSLLTGSFIRDKVPPNSRLVVISNFSNPQKEMGKAFRSFRSRAIAVTPIDIGMRGYVFPEPVIMMGSLEMRVDLRIVSALGNHAADKRSQRRVALLKAHQGRKIDDSALSCDRDGLRKTAKLLARPVTDKDAKTRCQFEGRVVIPHVGKLVPLSGAKISSVLALGSTGILKAMEFEVKVSGSTALFELLAGARLRQGRATRLAAPDVFINPADIGEGGRFDAKAAFEDDPAAFVSRMREHKFGGRSGIATPLDDCYNVPSPFEQLWPEVADLRCPYLYDAFGYGDGGGRDMLEDLRVLSGSARTRPKGKSKIRLPMSKDNASPQNSAVDQASPKRRWLARANVPLKGSDAYLPMIVGCVHDPLTCEFEPGSELALESFERAAGRVAVIGFRRWAAQLVGELVPLAAKFIGRGKRMKNRVKVRLAGSESPFVGRLFNLPLPHFREQIRQLLGEQLHDQLTTQTFAFDELDSQTRGRWQALLEKIQNMTANEAMMAIADFVIQNYAYRQYEGLELLMLENLRERAAAGECQGANEYLGLVLSLGGGKCSELSQVALALLRAAGIPTAIFGGYVAEGKKIDGEAHQWAGVVAKDLDGTYVSRPVEVAINSQSKSAQALASMVRSAAEAALAKASKAVEGGGVPHGNGELLAVETKVFGRKTASERYLERLWYRLTIEEQDAIAFSLNDLLSAQELEGAVFAGKSVPVHIMQHLGMRGEYARKNRPLSGNRFQSVLAHIAVLAQDPVPQLLEHLPAEAGSGYATKFVEALSMIQPA
ncbi:MAG: DUF58 domain-containing protein [Candidatus Saganbacteria bacterium]|nr:DUF58 domain-containing protein [Candidatus Saganbacteria bacterium]